MIFDGNKVRPFSAAFGRQLQQLERYIDEAVKKIMHGIGQGDRESTGTWVKITGYTGWGSSYPIAKYSGVQVAATSATGTNADWATLTGGKTYTNTLINSLENGNDASTAYGLAAAWDGTYWKLSTAPFTGNIIMPVPTNAVVRVFPSNRKDGVQRGAFTAPIFMIPGCEA